jgi:tetratricopeptide (TPR) repeat protein
LNKLGSDRVSRPIPLGRFARRLGAGALQGEPVQKQALSIAVLIVASVGFDPVAAAQESKVASAKEAAARAPKDAGQQTAYGRVLIAAGRLREAEAQMAAAAKLSGGGVEASYELARVKFATGDYKASRAYCRDLTEKAPDHVLSHVCMARAMLVWRRSSLAFEHVDRALALAPDDFEARLALADARRIQGDLAGAQDAYAQALAVRAGSAEVHHGLGLLYVAFGKLDEARASFQKALAAAPDDPDVQLELARVTTGPEGLRLAEAALAGRPGWLDAKLAVGIARVRAGDAAGAEEIIRAFLKDNPDHPAATAQLGVALVALGKLGQAESILARAIELQPNDYDAAFALARLFEQGGKNEEAVAQYRKAADIRQSDAAPLVAAARLNVSIGRHLLAIALLDKALARSPRSAEALALYGDALFARGDKKGARDFYQRALAGEGPVDRDRIQARLGP